MNRRGGPRLKRPIRKCENASSVFQEECTSNKLPIPMLKGARRTGELNLFNRGLVSIPEDVWNINEAQDFDNKDVQNFGSAKEDPAWWEHKDLFRLILGSNKLSSIPSQLQKLETLTHLDVNDNQLTSLPDVLDRLSLLCNVNASRNKIAKLPNSLYTLQNLQRLYLQHNEIEVLDEAFGDLNSLTDLDISHNRLVEIPVGFGWLTNIRTLNLSHNNIASLPEEIGALPVLQTLDISCNKLPDLPDSLGNLLRLEVLNASQNAISSLFAGEKPLILKELRVGGNAIKCISEDFVRIIPNISILDFRENCLTELPENISQLHGLTALILNNNNLKSIPWSIGALPNLTCLQLDGNGLRSIRRDILQRGTAALMSYLKSRIVENVEVAQSSNLDIDLEKIRYSSQLDLENQQLTDVQVEVFEEAAKGNIKIVNLSKNKFTHIPEGVSLLAGSLEQLIMNRNLLSRVADFLGQASRLLYLNLEANKLEDLPLCLGKLPHLREINLSHNRFLAIPECIFDMKALEILLLNNNQVTVINTDGLSKCKILTVLSFADNNINVVPPELGLLTQLRSLSLQGNPFRVPRHAILEKGTEAVLSYLRDRMVLK